MVAEPSAYPVFCRLSEAAVDDIVAIELESNQAPWSRKLFLSEFQARHSLVFGSRVAGALIGYIVIHVVIDEAHIMNFGLLQGFRGLGYGKRLLFDSLNELHLRGVRWVTLEVRRSNLVARELYERTGFIEMGVRPRYYSDNGEDALVMRLNMAEFQVRATKAA